MRSGGLILGLVLFGLGLGLAGTTTAWPQSAGQQWAQAGSIGGKVGKRGKSASGGEPVAKPAAKPAAKPRARHKKTPRSRAARPKRSAPHHATISGRWRITAKCSTGVFKITANLRQTSATSFTGNTIGHTTGEDTKITSSSLNGNAFTWVRRGRFATLRAHGHVNGNHMEGNENGPIWTCTFTGTRR